MYHCIVLTIFVLRLMTNIFPKKILCLNFAVHANSINLGLFQDVLAEIPSQVVQYFERMGVKPGLPEIEIATRRFQNFQFCSDEY